MTKAIRLINATFLSLMIAGGLFAQIQDNTLTKKNVKINGRFKASIWEAVHELANEGIPIGFEAREHSDIDTDSRIVMKSGTLEDILDSIVKQDIFYTWEENDGVINVYPVMDRNEKSASFLATRIGPFNVSPGDDRASTVERISSSFNNGVGQDSKVWFLSAIGKGNTLGLPDQFKEEINIPASDIRTVLNKLTKSQLYSPLWTVRTSQDRKTITVVF